MLQWYMGLFLAGSGEKQLWEQRHTWETWCEIIRGAYDNVCINPTSSRRMVIRLSSWKMKDGGVWILGVDGWGGTKTRPVDFPEDKIKKWLFRGSRVKCRLAISNWRKLKWKGGAGGETNLQGKLLRYTVWKTARFFFLISICIDYFDLNSNISCS